MRACSVSTLILLFSRPDPHKPLLSRARRVLPHLSLVRGTGWESKHWLQLFSILGVKGKSKADISLKDLLLKAEAITAAVPQIKELNAQAQSEAIIRKALDELDMWGFQRKFELLESRDSGGLQVRVLLPLGS